MTDPSDFVTGTIDDLLLSIADGIVYAQQSLDRLQTVDPLGKPGPTYQLPYVDFELRVAAQFKQDAVLDQRYPASSKAATESKHLVMRAIAPQDTTVGGFQGEIISTLKGRFVAVPPNGGRPPLVLSTAVQAGAGGHTLEVRLRNALGEPVVGQPVHFNLDSQLSVDLSDADGVTLSGLQPTTTVQHGLVTTDATGLATTVLSTDPASPEPSGASIAVVIDAADRSEILVVIAP